VGNHNAAVMTPDSFLLAAALYRRSGLRDLPFGLGHEVAICLPGVHQLIVPLGAVRASHDNAARLFARGHKVLVYPGGDYDSMRPFRHRNRIVFGGRRGYIRLALRCGVPIVPVVAAGAHSTFIVLDDMRWFARWSGLGRLFRVEVWPLALSIPWGLTWTPLLFFVPFPSRIRVEVLDPIRFDRTGPGAAADETYVAACACRVEQTMQHCLDRLTA
jgi:1-acyl-sn-glycerol-3-phosphate acyltransferase